MRFIRLVGKWLRISFLTGLLLFFVVAIIQLNKDIEEHGWHYAFGEYYDN